MQLSLVKHLIKQVYLVTHSQQTNRFEESIFASIFLFVMKEHNPVPSKAQQCPPTAEDGSQESSHCQSSTCFVFPELNGKLPFGFSEFGYRLNFSTLQSTCEVD